MSQVAAKQITARQIVASQITARGIGVSSGSSDAGSVINRMTGLTTVEVLAITDFVNSQVVAGNWALIDEVYCFGLTLTANALTGFKEFTAASPVSMTHEPGNGYSAGGASSYIDSNITPKTLADGDYNFEVDDAFVSVYLSDPQFTNTSSSKFYLFGAGNTTGSTGQACSINFKPSTGDYQAYLNKPGSSKTVTPQFQLNAVHTAIKPAASELDVWFNSAPTYDNTQSATYAADQKIHICGRTDNSGSHQSGSGLRATYGLFAIGGGAGFDVIKWEQGVRELMYALGHRPAFYVDPTVAAGAFGSETYPLKAFTGTEVASWSGDQFGRQLLLKRGTTIEDQIDWSSGGINRVSIDRYGSGANPIIDGSAIVDTSGDWTLLSGDVYYNDSVMPVGDRGFWIKDASGVYQMCHWRETLTDLQDSTMQSYSNGYTKFWDTSASPKRLYVRANGYNLATDPNNYATTSRLGTRARCIYISSGSSSDVTIKNIQMQRGGGSNMKVNGLNSNLIVDSVASIECGDWTEIGGCQAFSVGGGSNAEILGGVGSKLTNITVYGLWNANGNAIETKNVKNMLLEDWTVHDINNNVFELYLTTQHCTFRRIRAWNCKNFAWLANESGTGGDLRHVGNIFEDSFARNYINYKGSSSAGKNTILIASGEDNVFQNNTFVGEKTNIILENVKNSGVISNNTYRNNIIYMDANSGTKAIISTTTLATDININNNVVYTTDNLAAQVLIEAAGVKTTLAIWNAFGIYPDNITTDPGLVDVNSGGGVAPATQSMPNLTIPVGSSAAGIADANVTLTDVDGTARLNSAGAYTAIV